MAFKSRETTNQGKDAAAARSSAQQALGERFHRESSPGYWTNQLSRRFLNRLSRELQPLGIGSGLFGPLVWLWEKDNRTQADLCRCLGLEQSTMARTLARMERGGLIRRVPDPQDRRAARIRLTEKGRSLRDEAHAAAHRVNHSAFAGLSTQEAETFFRLAERMIENLDHTTEDDA